MCSLNDFAPPRKTYLSATWPCQQVMPQLDEQERSCILKQAGLLRFEQKTHAFVELLHKSYPHSAFSAYDLCLITALAEGLGYGRDRAFFRAAGQRLLGLESDLPEPLGRTFDPSPLDRGRLYVLRGLVEQWRERSAWQTLREIVSATTVQKGAETDAVMHGGPGELPPVGKQTPGNGKQANGRLHRLHAVFQDLGTARADILICNVVLPFAMAVALIEHDTKLAEQAQILYTEHPGLSSNRITRAMCNQLQLTREPRGACEQQGLQHIYQQTCKDKRCELCMVGERKL